MRSSQPAAHFAYTFDAVVVHGQGREIAASCPIAAPLKLRAAVYELRIKTAGDLEASSSISLRPASMQADATRRDRVFVPGDGGSQQLFALRRRRASRFGQLRYERATL